MGVGQKKTVIFCYITALKNYKNSNQERRRTL